MSATGKSPVMGIDSVIKFLQVQKDAYLKQERTIKSERDDLRKALEDLEKCLEEEKQKENMLKSSLQQYKEEIHPVSAVASGRLDYKGHHRTRSDLRGSYKNLREQQKDQNVPGHSRKKSHQDYMLKLETELPSHIRQNIKSLIANRINTETGAARHLRLSDIAIRPSTRQRQGRRRPSSIIHRQIAQVIPCCTNRYANLVDVSDPNIQVCHI